MDLKNIVVFNCPNNDELMIGELVNKPNHFLLQRYNYKIQNSNNDSNIGIIKKNIICKTYLCNSGNYILTDDFREEYIKIFELNWKFPEIRKQLEPYLSDLMIEYFDY